MPRSKDFGLNESVFQAKYCKECPETFYKIAFMCCNINPDARYDLMFSFHLVTDVFSLFKGVVTTVASEVVGYRILMGGRKGNA